MALPSLPESPHTKTESHQLNLPKGDSTQLILMFEGVRCGAKKGPCKSHGKGLPRQACPPSVQTRTLVSILGTILKGHF